MVSFVPNVSSFFASFLYKRKYSEKRVCSLARENESEREMMITLLATRKSKTKGGQLVECTCERHKQSVNRHNNKHKRRPGVMTVVVEDTVRTVLEYTVVLRSNRHSRINTFLLTLCALNIESVITPENLRLLDL
jgi:hypothetical protein